MPTPHRVFGVSSKQRKHQMYLTTSHTKGVACGTTLQTAAPLNRARPVKLANSLSAVLSNQAPVGMSVCLTTRLEFASPRCVFVLPMSNRRIISPPSHPLQ